MTPQLPLALRLQHAPTLDDFVVGRNRAVIDALSRSLDGSGERLIYLSGPAGCGRSHLLLAQCAAGQRRGLRCAYLPLAGRASLAPAMLDGWEALDLVAIDDVQLVARDRAWEEALFALFNLARDRGSRLLFSADRGPAVLPLDLPDLRTRLAWGLTLSVQPLDDDGRLALLHALASRHALTLDDGVARYLLERTSRQPMDLVDTISRLDRASLSAQRRLTIPFVRESLGL